MSAVLCVHGGLIRLLLSNEPVQAMLSVQSVNHRLVNGNVGDCNPYGGSEETCTNLAWRFCRQTDQVLGNATQTDGVRQTASNLINPRAVSQSGRVVSVSMGLGSDADSRRNPCKCQSSGCNVNRQDQPRSLPGRWAIRLAAYIHHVKEPGVPIRSALNSSGQKGG